MLLSLLRNEVEDKRNAGIYLLLLISLTYLYPYGLKLYKGLTSQQKAAVTEFWKAQNVLLVVTAPLFEDIGDPSKIETPKITRSQLSCK
jgi:hypothetical protein